MFATVTHSFTSCPRKKTGKNIVRIANDIIFEYCLCIRKNMHASGSLPAILLDTQEITHYMNLWDVSDASWRENQWYVHTCVKIANLKADLEKFVLARLDLRARAIAE